MDCPPIIFLVFNRPDLTQRVFQSLSAQQPTSLYVVADGPRVNNKEDERLCEEVRSIVTQVDWPCDVTYDFSEENLGCARRVSSGVTKAFELFEEAIVLEDDCLPDETFYEFCAMALKHFRKNEDVVCVTGDNFQNGILRGDGSFYFSKYPHCWGWATWRRAWAQFDLGMKSWPKWRDSTSFEGLFESDERSFWTSIFDRCFKDEIDTWAFPWTFACWQMNGKTVTPNTNLVTNIGFDERGTHTYEADSTEQLSTPLQQFVIPSSSTIDERADRFTYENHFGGLNRNQQCRRSLSSQLKPSIRRLASTTKLTERLARRLGTSISKSGHLAAQERRRILAMPRYTNGETSLFGMQTRFVDGPSFLSAHDAIFVHEIYRFNSKSPAPLILDCGANVGLSVLFFARNHPRSSIFAFEPDPSIFATLETNIQSWQLKNVSLKNSAVWDSEGFLEFSSEGADAGKLTTPQASSGNLIKVPTEPLSRYLSEPVEFLKIDIEGAETTVLESVQNQLGSVNKLFVEYHSFANEQQTLDKLLSVLARSGFRYSIHAEHRFEKPFSTPPRSSGMDLGLNIFCWRERWITQPLSSHSMKEVD